jgi:hydroxymethylpyrimidine/phosphomethylpyrimidine kinase
LDCLHSDLPPLGIKIGMLANAEIVAAVAAYLSRFRSHTPVTVVLDPVLKSSSGRDLLDTPGRRAIVQDLLPLVDWITPNRAELASLLDCELREVDDIAGAARDLQKQGSQLHVVVTGGDLDPPVDLLLQPSRDAESISGKHIQTTSSHGTGCAFSSALLSRLILGDQPLQAVQAAKAYVSRAMETAKPIGSGHGPLHHLWPLDTQP